jgi:hypothetical protein
MRFIDIETGEVLTLADLEKEYKFLFSAGETEANSFSDYLKNCTSKNGTLERL